MRELFEGKRRNGYIRLNKLIISGTAVYPSIFALRWREFI